MPKLTASEVIAGVEYWLRMLAWPLYAASTLSADFFAKIHFVNFAMKRAAANAELFRSGGDVAIRGGKRLGN